MVAAYVPDAGDLVWLTFDPQMGRDQAGRRPAVVLSPAAYNGRTGLAIACPVTSHAKGYPFEVPLPKGFPISGVVLADHLKSIDWKCRRAEKGGRVARPTMEQITDRIAALIGLRD